MPDLRLLATYLAVVDNGSMAEAAQVTGYVPSAISQQIGNLERGLAVELLARKPGRRVAPTAAGRSLERAARSLFQAVTSFQDVAARISDSQVAEIRIGSFASAMTYLLPGVLAQMAEEDSGVLVHMVEVETPQGLPMLKNGDIDLLVAYRYLPDDPPTEDDDWVVASLGQEALVLTSSGHHDERSLEQCLTSSWVLGFSENADTRLLRRWALNFDATLKIRFETEDFHAAMAIIEHDLAVGLLPATTVRGPLEAGRLRPVRLPPAVEPFSRELLVVTRSNYHPALVDRTVQRLRLALEASARPAAD